MNEKFFNNRFLILYLSPFILGSLTVFSFQPFNIAIINFIILPFFFYLIIFINKKSKSIYRKKPYKKNLFIFGTLFGFGYFLSGLHWITNSLTFDESFKILIPFSLILLPLFLSLFFGLFTILVGPFLKNNLPSILLFSFGLAISDFIRAKIFTGFPWNLWVYSLSSFEEIIQIVNIVGLFAFNLIAITIFVLPVTLIFNIKFINKVLYLATIFFLILSLFIFGNFSINKNNEILNNSTKKYLIKVISPNFKLEYNLSKKFIGERIDKLVRYSEPKANLKTLFVWPEGVFSGYSYKDLKIFKEKFKNNFNENHYILFGINRFHSENNGFYNSLVIINNNFEIINEYNKQKLVPFGEFLPFESILTKFGLKKITEGYGSFLKGTKQDNLKLEELNILPLICYEIIFTKFIQDASKSTNIIINISEDGWFGNSIGPHQHFAKAIMRAVEQNSYLIRSANKGISAIINNKGEVLKKLKPSETGIIELEVPLINSKNKNKNDLIFFTLLFTYIFIFRFYKNKNV